jgi:hypothetical protein
MIDRKTAKICAVLIALMLVAAVWRITLPDDWTILAVQGKPKLPTLLLFVFPAASALVAGVLYWTGLRAKADLAKRQPWYKWGAFISISYCGSLLLLQTVAIAQSLHLHTPVPLPAIAGALRVLLTLLSLLAINQMPKLPYFERSSSPGGDLGPIYGPRFIRTQSRILIAFMLAVFAYSFVIPANAEWRSVLFILFVAASLVVQSIVWRRHLGRKWSLEQTAHGARS